MFRHRWMHDDLVSCLMLKYFYVHRDVLDFAPMNYHRHRCHLRPQHHYQQYYVARETSPTGIRLIPAINSIEQNRKNKLLQMIFTLNAIKLIDYCKHKHTHKKKLEKLSFLEILHNSSTYFRRVSYRISIVIEFRNLQQILMEMYVLQ